MEVLSYILTAFGGFIFGVVITCVLLSKKNLEAYQKMSESTTTSMKTGFEAAKAVYKAQVEAYENGTELVSEVSDDDTDDTKIIG